jgi:hypothetical protein
MTATSKYAAAFMLLLVALGTVSTGAETFDTQSLFIWVMCVIKGDLGFISTHRIP